MRVRGWKEKESGKVGGEKRRMERDTSYSYVHDVSLLG